VPREAMSDGEERQHPRLPVSLECHLVGTSGRMTVRISNLSLAGCYVDTATEIALGSVAIVTVGVRGEVVTLSGVVTHTPPGLGFGMQFDSLSEKTHRQIEALLRSLSSEP
jgi:hypothetical protein